MFPWLKRSQSTVKTLVVIENFGQYLTPAADMWFTALESQGTVRT